MTKKKGFTLVELMIVLAVIALLIVVLLPRIGPIKNKSRETGIKTNMAMLEGIVMSNIDNFTATDNAAGVDGLEAKIASDLTTVAVDNQKFKNPITGGTGVCSTGAAGLSAATAVGYVATTDDTGLEADITTAWDAPGHADIAGSAGNIVYCAYVNGSQLNVKLIPFGVDNKRIATLEKTLSQ